jgi:hypothetical protein
LDILKFSAVILGWAYALWPVLIFLPLAWRRTNLFQDMFVAWSAEFVCWIAAHFIAIKAFLIPEPLNLWLFASAGLILFIMRFFVRPRKS